MLLTLAVFVFCAAGVLGTNWVEPTLAPAREMMATIYDDGKACPGNCDAHVVFDRSNNGTSNAYDPSSKRTTPEKCRIGQTCTICFSDAAESCMSALYRGAGPGIDRFDFTPAFYEQNCNKTGLPIQFTQVCTTLAARMKKYEAQVNCILTPDDKRCAAVINPARLRKKIDDPIFDKCQQMGTKAFNALYPGHPEKQRMDGDCGYEKLRTGHNSNKTQTWHRLLDGACRSNNYVGIAGTDCCTGSIYAAAGLITECNRFFANKK
jgi:hypothetical protein